MRIIVNETLIERRATAAQRTLRVGIMLMLAAVFLSFNRQFVLLAYGFTFVGFLTLNWGGRQVAKWHRKPRVDQALAKALKGLDHGQRLYSYLLPAEHTILSPTGVTVLKAKPQDGKVSCHRDRWHRRFSLGILTRSFAEERLGNPTRQAQDELEKMRGFVASHLPDADVPMRPIIVFVDDNAELDVLEPTVPVLHLRDLKAHLRTAAKGQPMPRSTLDALTDLCDEQAS